jgi:hypothetical protein
MSLSLEDLEPKGTGLPRSSRQHRAAPPPDFPPCPPERGENNWRLVRLFIETGEANGRTRVISPWLLAKELAARISADPVVLKFISDQGAEMAEDILSRMIRLYWRFYVDSGMSRTAIVNQYLDDYWDDLFDQAKTEYTTDLIQADIAAGTLKVIPHREVRSLQNDAEYQAALENLRVEERLTNLSLGDEPQS